MEEYRWGRKGREETVRGQVKWRKMEGESPGSQRLKGRGMELVRDGVR